MEHIISLFSLAPVLKGFIAMLVAGAGFPLCGVMVLRLNLVPMRYMLMHGVILGGAIALALSLPVAPVTAVVNVALVFCIIALTKNSSYGFGAGSAAAMVFSMALASLIMHIADVPAKDTLSLLWGSPFALTKADMVMLFVIVLVLVVYVVANGRTINALFFNQDVARSLGIKVRLHYIVMVLLIALVIAFAMKILGALLIDALLVLPVVIASKCLTAVKRNGIKPLFVGSSVAGFIISFVGFIIAVLFNLPPSASIALTAGALFFGAAAIHINKGASL